MPPPVSEPFTIRVASENEYLDVGDLTVNGYQADGYLTRPDGTFDDHYAGWLRNAALRGEAGGLLVAVDSVGLVGTVTWCAPGSPFRELATADHQGELRTLSVAPFARGRGVGHALVQECLHRARELDLDEMVLCSLPEMKPAHRLYESFGFKRRPDLDWSPFEGVTLWGFSLSL